MTVLIVLVSVLAFILLICFIRVGISAEYSKDGILVRAHLGPVHKTVYPAEKLKEEKKLRKKEKKEKAGLLEELKEHWPDIKKLLSKIKRKRFINELTVYYIAAGPDPAKAALTFGGVSALYGIITAVLENNFQIKKRDLRTAVDFDAKDPYIYIKAKLTLAVWEAVYVLYDLVRITAEKKKQN